MLTLMLSENSHIVGFTEAELEEVERHYAKALGKNYSTLSVEGKSALLFTYTHKLSAEPISTLTDTSYRAIGLRVGQDARLVTRYKAQCGAEIKYMFIIVPSEVYSSGEMWGYVEYYTNIDVTEKLKTGVLRPLKRTVNGEVQELPVQYNSLNDFKQFVPIRDFIRTLSIIGVEVHMVNRSLEPSFKDSVATQNSNQTVTGDKSLDGKIILAMQAVGNVLSYARFSPYQIKCFFTCIEAITDKRERLHALDEILHTGAGDKDMLNMLMTFYVDRAEEMDNAYQNSLQKNTSTLLQSIGMPSKDVEEKRSYGLNSVQNVKDMKYEYGHVKHAYKLPPSNTLYTIYTLKLETLDAVKRAYLIMLPEVESSVVKTELYHDTLDGVYVLIYTLREESNAIYRRINEIKSSVVKPNTLLLRVVHRSEHIPSSGRYQTETIRFISDDMDYLIEKVI